MFLAGREIDRCHNTWYCSDIKRNGIARREKIFMVVVLCSIYYSSKIATARVQPALPPLILAGKQATLKP